MAVGKSSSRTPFKHWILDSELGRICGVLTTGKVHAKACPFHVIDLCAGDGHISEESSKSSPEIITRHCKWMLSKCMETKATLIERGDLTFRELLKNTPDFPWLERLHIDARDYQLSRQDRHQAIFLHADPNTIADWPVTKQLLDSMSETTTMLATLGCNVGGLKRLDVGERLGWYDHVQQCLDAMPKYHDLILVELVNDASQWAYMLRLPAVWALDTMHRLQTQGKQYTNFGLSMASVRTNADGFKTMEDRLFLTKKERGEK